VAPDIFSYGQEASFAHRAQKPVALFQDLLSRSVLPGNKVLDPFCGTGTILPAADALQCIAYAVELDPVFYGVTVERAAGLGGPT
jgi:DNA modification methylase